MGENREGLPVQVYDGLVAARINDLVAVFGFERYAIFARVGRRQQERHSVSFAEADLHRLSVFVRIDRGIGAKCGIDLNAVDCENHLFRPSPEYGFVGCRVVIVGAGGKKRKRGCEGCEGENAKDVIFHNYLL